MQSLMNPNTKANVLTDAVSVGDSRPQATTKHASQASHIKYVGLKGVV